MDIDLYEEQQMIQNAARDFLTAKCQPSLAKEMIDDERGYLPELWREIADLGWLGLIFPTEYGGENSSFLDLVVILEEMGRACFPGPFFSTVIFGGLTILYGGNEAQKTGLLPKICRGESLLTLALTEPDFSFEPAGITLEAVRDGEDFILSGTKMFVPDAHIANLLICVARTGKSKKAEDGITIFLVDAKSPGLKVNMLKTVDGSKQCEVIFEKVKVPATNILGEPDKGWGVIKKILEFAAVAKCAEMLGGAERVLEMTTQYAKERQQFDSPIGSFQVIQHFCADMITDVDTMRLITYEAAWMLSEGIPCSKEVSMAKAWVSDAFRRVVLLGQKIHGGIGFMEDHDMSLYYRKAQMAASSIGDADFHRDLVARELGFSV